MNVQLWTILCIVELYHLLQVPPPTHGIAALMAMNILELEKGLSGMSWNSAERLHVVRDTVMLKALAGLRV